MANRKFVIFTTVIRGESGRLEEGKNTQTGRVSSSPWLPRMARGRRCGGFSGKYNVGNQ